MFDEGVIRSVKWYEVKANPLTNERDYIVPLVFPLKRDYFNTFSFYLNEDESPIANLYVFMDANKLDHYIAQMNKNASSKVILYNYDHQPISLPPNSNYYELSKAQAITDFIADPDTVGNMEFIYDSQAYMVTKSSFGINGFTLINIISKTQLLAPLDALKGQVIRLLIYAVLFSLVISFVVSKSITSPLKKLMVLVTDIGKGHYRQSPHYAYNDEIGKLRNSLNELSGIINRQIDVIKSQEKAYAEAEIDILTQQINPHFLYNTLDYIQWEILDGNKKGASNMIESLAVFLRLGLNQGARLIKIESEVKRLEEYIHIINQRQKSAIRLATHYDESIAHHPLLILMTRLPVMLD